MPMPSSSKASSSSSSSSSSSIIPLKRKLLDPTMIPLSNASNINLLQYHLPPIPDLGIPPLPPISNQALEQQAYTHSSVAKKIRRAQSLDMDTIEDNEKLEHVGDAILNTTVTLLLHEMFPHLQVGAATMMKGHLVSNRTLSQISNHYDLPSRLIASPEQVRTLRAGEKTQANMLEAYVAALYLSYLPSTPSTASPSEEAQAAAYVRVATWLRPLFRPLATWVLSELKVEQARLEAVQAGSNEDSDLDNMALGSTARLNEYMIKFHKTNPEYLASRAGSAAWTVMCKVADKTGNSFSAEATRTTKKAASQIAAYKVCLEMKL